MSPAKALSKAQRRVHSRQDVLENTWLGADHLIAVFLWEFLGGHSQAQVNMFLSYFVPFGCPLNALLNCIFREKLHVLGNSGIITLVVKH